MTNNSAKDETIKIAGTAIPIRAWGVGKQMAVAFSNSGEADEKPLSLAHQMALAYHAGYIEAKREGVKEIDLKETILSLDEVADKLRNLQRKTIDY